MKNLKMNDVISKEYYHDLTASERKILLKAEQAKEYSGFRKYPSTCAAIMEHLPEDIWNRYTAEQIGEIMQIAHNAYIKGKDSKRED